MFGLNNNKSNTGFSSQELYAGVMRVMASVAESFYQIQSEITKLAGM